MVTPLLSLLSSLPPLLLLMQQLVHSFTHTSISADLLYAHCSHLALLGQEQLGLQESVSVHSGKPLNSVSSLLSPLADGEVTLTNPEVT